MSGISNSAWKSFHLLVGNNITAPVTSLWTPQAGTIITGFKYSVPTAFDGTTPKGDIGLFIGTNQGFLAHGGGFMDLATADTSSLGTGTEIISFASLGQSFLYPILGIKLIGSHPIQFAFSQDGTSDGTAAGSTAGTVDIHIEYFVPQGIG